MWCVYSALHLSADASDMRHAGRPVGLFLISGLAVDPWFVADCAAPGAGWLAVSPAAALQLVRDKLIEFVRETARHITTTADVSPELQQLRYCLCAVARQCGQQLGEALPQAFPAQVRRGLGSGLQLHEPLQERQCGSTGQLLP